MRFRRKKLEISPPYVSMADIAFNLVLFFLILAHTQDDSHLQWDPVKAENTQQIANSRISITVDREGKIYLNGQEVGVDDLVPGITQQLESSPDEKASVLLKIHKETLSSTWEPIMKAVGQTGCEIVHVLDEEVK